LRILADVTSSASAGVVEPLVARARPEKCERHRELEAVNDETIPAVFRDEDQSKRKGQDRQHERGATPATDHRVRSIRLRSTLTSPESAAGCGGHAFSDASGVPPARQDFTAGLWRFEQMEYSDGATETPSSSSEYLMGKTIVVVGFGPGISTAVAEKFGSSGFSVALVARNEEKLAAGVKALKAKGIEAAAFKADAADPAAIRGALGKARAALGPITVVQWNAYGGAEAGDLVTADPTAVRTVFDVAVVGLLAAIQEALPDLKNSKEGAVLVTNGAFGELNPQIDEYAVNAKAMGLAVANAAKHKLVGLLAQRLKGDGIYVGEVMVAGTIKGSAWDSGNANLDGATIANKFWELYQARGEIRARVS
jgi:NADP-dependent 3-hydroxy acid dehydrogenase YdfG